MRTHRARKLVSATTALLLSLSGVAHATTVFPSSKDFGSQMVGSSSSATSFQLMTSPSGCSVFDPMSHECTSAVPNSANTSELGAGPGTTTNVGDFVVHNVNCDYPALMSPAVYLLTGICQFEVSFAPGGPGLRSKTFSFPENAGPPNQALTVSGTGLIPAVPPVPTPRKKCKKKHRSAAEAKKCRKKKR